MSNSPNTFGNALEQARIDGGLSKRKFAATAGYELRGIQKILKGEREPGVLLALRLVSATGQNVGEFFEKLNQQLSTELQTSLSNIAETEK